MPLFGTGIFRDAKTGCIFVCTVLIAYYFVMDIILFMRFKTVNIVSEAKPGPPGEPYSPFTHLTVKAIMNDPTSQYIIGPSAEYFDMITKFSSVFSFITPNMISLTHLALGLVAGKFIASENLYDRRVGVIIFQFRVWLDALDGVVYRSHTNSRLMFKSMRSTLGYYMDITCDAFGGVFLCFGILFYLYKRFDHFRQELPTFLPQEVAMKSVLPTNGHSLSSRESYSKKYLFWKVFCFGISLACAGKFWDSAVEKFEDVFQVPLSDPKLSVSMILKRFLFVNSIFCLEFEFHAVSSSPLSSSPSSSSPPYCHRLPLYRSQKIMVIFICIIFFARYYRMR